MSSSKPNEPSDCMELTICLPPHTPPPQEGFEENAELSNELRGLAAMLLVIIATDFEDTELLHRAIALTSYYIDNNTKQKADHPCIECAKKLDPYIHENTKGEMSKKEWEKFEADYMACVRWSFERIFLPLPPVVKEAKLKHQNP